MTRRSMLPLLACLTFLPCQPARVQSAPAQDKVRPKPRTDCHGDPLPPGAVARLGTVRLQHGEETGGLAFSPDGKTLASGGNDGSVRLWDVATGREVRRFTGHKGLVRWVAFAPDGKALAATDDSRVRVWDLVTGKRVFERPASERRPAGVAFSPDGKILAAGSAGGAITLFDRKTGKRLGRLGGGEHGSYLLAFSPDGRLLAASAFDRTVDLLDVRTGERLRTYPSAAHEVSALAFAPDGKTLAAAADDTVRLWAVHGPKEVRRFTLTDASVSWLRFSPGGKTLTAVSTDGRVADWETATGKVVRRVGNVQGDFSVTAVAPDGNTAASSARFGDIQLVDLTAGKERSVAGACPSPILAVGFAEQGRTVLSTCLNTTTLVWDPTSGRELRRFRPQQTYTETAPVALSPQGTTLVFGDEKGTIHLWDVAGGRKLRSWKGHQGETWSFAFSPGGRTLLTAGLHGPPRVWSVESGKERYSLDDADDDSRFLAFAPDGRTFAAFDGQNQMRIWETATGRRRLTFQLQDLPSCVAFSPDSTLIGVGEYEGGLVLYRASTGRFVRRLVAPDPTANRASESAAGTRAGDQQTSTVEAEDCGPIFALSFSPDGKYLASGPKDRTVWLHDVATGRLVARLIGHQGIVTALAFSPDGKRLVSGSADRTALVWDVEAVVRPRAPGKSPPGGKAGAVRSTAVGKLAPIRLDKLWAALGGADGERAGAALNELVAHPGKAVPFLAGRLHPAPPADAQRLVRLVADLESDQFPVREKAAKELEAAAERAEPVLRKVLEGKPPLEKRRRVERLLEKLDLPLTSPEALRSLRAVEALERMGTPEAGELLRRLARGAAEARLTREAKAALDRPPFRRRS